MFSAIVAIVVNNQTHMVVFAPHQLRDVLKSRDANKYLGVT